MSITPLMPRQQVPALSVPTVGGDTWTLAEQSPEHFTLVVFYRGLYCPICKQYLNDLQAHLDEFRDLGIGVFALSGDTEERAKETKEKWGLDKLSLGYGLSLDDARAWGLYISSSNGASEPERFSEPALYMIRPDGTLYFGAVQTMPFARPQFADIVKAAKFVIDKDYPARGEVTDHKA